MKKLFALLALSLSLLASTCTSPARAQDRSWPEYTLGSRTHPFGIGVLQQLLNARGYRVRMDSDFGAQTRAALLRFQKAHDLEATGTSTGETWEALLVRVRRGSHGQAVRAVQDMLSLLDFKTKTDSVFGAGTERVLKSFQQARGLTVDGVAGPETWSALVMESATKYE